MPADSVELINALSSLSPMPCPRSLRSDVDRVLDDAGVRAPVGYGGGGDPTEHMSVLNCHVPVIRQPAGVEMSPVRRSGFEGGVTRRDALGVDG